MALKTQRHNNPKHSSKFSFNYNNAYYLMSPYDYLNTLGILKSKSEIYRTNSSYLLSSWLKTDRFYQILDYFVQT